MSGNPFRNDQQNPYDLPMVNGKQIGGGSPQQSGMEVLFDAATQSASPAGKAMIDAMMAQLRAEQAAQIKTAVSAMAKATKPLVDRIKTLERQLDVKRSDTAAAIQSEIDGFLGAEDDGPTLDELNRMASDHKKQMEGLKR